jgi:two-component system phosphate regulon sensor histidine kinase PhoR
MVGNFATSERSAARSRIERSVFLSQLILAGAILVLVIISAVSDPAMLTDPRYFAGIVLVFANTGVAAALPWGRIAKPWITILPIVDIIALALIRDAQPLLGASLLFVFPVIWLSTHYGIPGAAGSVLFSSALVWGTSFFDGTAPAAGEVPRLAIIPIMLAFVATTTYSTTRRTNAQRVLLTQQAGLFEAALVRSRRQEQTLDEIFDAVDFGVIGFDNTGKTNLVNRAQRELLARLGVAPGRPVTDLVYAEDRVTAYSEIDRPFQRALDGETIDRVTVWVGEPGKEQAALLVSARPLIDDRGRYDGGVMVLRDVTAELRAIKARDDLVASVSHELRTPLTSIVGYLELALDDERIVPETRRMLDVASKNGDRLLALVADLLAAASDTKHSLILEFAHCDLAEIVTDAIESLRPLADNRDIEFEITTLPVVELEGDAFRLRQVIDNMLSNAIKYNVESGRIAVSLAVVGDAAELRIRDTGIGITAEDQEKLFDRFYRADSVRGSSVHGTGLGLSISRDIMRQHGGDLRLESTGEQGTTASATLPLRHSARDER